jgi:hypothetical protein
VRISSEIELTSGDSVDKSNLLAICKDEVEFNTKYAFTGRMWAHPDTNALVFLLSKAEHMDNALDTFTLEQPEDLMIFRPFEWTVASIKSKLKELYTDISHNVTQIYNRTQMHLAMDLAYFSPLWISSGRKQKGWVEVIIIGDTGQGKTVASEALRDFYALGERIVCKNSTQAGVIGGLKQMGGDKTWWVEWGAIPQNDRKLVVLEEIAGLDTNTIGQLTDMRSSGIATIEKIEKARAYARTRLIAIGNPRTKSLREFPHGILAIDDVIGKTEDVRRFDFAYIVSETEVPNVSAVKRNVKPVDHHFTAELNRQLILLAWSTKVVRIAPAVRDKIFDEADKLNKKYAAGSDLINAATTDEKLTRLSAALAARTYSYNDKLELVVRECHVDFMVWFIQQHYDTEYVGYDELAAKSLKRGNIDREEEIRKIFQNTTRGKSLAGVLLEGESLDRSDIENAFGCEPDQAREIMSTLILNRAVKKAKRGYSKTPAFTDLLRKYEQNGLLETPTHIKDEF